MNHWMNYPRATVGQCFACLGRHNVIAASSIAVAVLLLYAPVFKGLYVDWLTLPDFSHGFLVPLVSVYVAWTRRADLLSVCKSPSNIGLLIILSAVFLLLFGTLASEYFTIRISFLLLLSGIIVFHLGLGHLKILLFPIMYMFFMIPIPSIFLTKITLPMQFFASWFAAVSLQHLGISVLREGNVIHLARSSLEVAEACSGIRSLVSLVAMGTLFAYFSNKNPWQKIVLLFACFPIAIFLNAFRVAVTGLLAQYYGNSVAEGFLHDFSGYLLFCLALVLLIFTSSILSLYPFRGLSKSMIRRGVCFGTSR